MNVIEYMQKAYSDPPCWDLVADVYTNEVVPKARSHWESLRTEDRIKWFSRATVSKEVPFIALLDAQPSQNYDVYYYTNPDKTPHVGVYYDGKILHATSRGVFYEYPYRISDEFELKGRWRYNGDDQKI